MKKWLLKVLKVSWVLFFLVCSAPGFGQERTISGTVVSEKDQSPLPGVTVMVTGTQTGTVTDANGHFSLTLPAKAKSLTFSFVGMQTKKVPVTAQNTYNVTMKEEVTGLDEVVVIGYGERKKRDVTTSVVSVRSDEIGKLQLVTPEKALLGTVSGVNVISGGGSPYARNAIQIRGVNTWGVSSPLIVIDGIPITEFGSGAEGNSSRVQDMRSPVNILSMINPNDIASISVLKDASAAAIYGMRASNGVILIETKQGIEGKTNIDFNMRYGVKNLPKTYSVLGVPDYVSLYQEAYQNADQVANMPSVFDSNSPDYLGDMPTVDWQGALLNKNAITQDYSLKFSGATKNVNYYVSSGYTDDESPLVAENLKRYSFASNINAKINKYIRAGLNFIGSYEHTNSNTWDNLDQDAGMAPWQPIYGDGPNGYAPVNKSTSRFNFDPTFLWGPATHSNTAGLRTMWNRQYELMRGLGKAYLEIEPVTGLRIRGRLSGDWYYNRRNLFQSVDQFYFLQTASDPLSLAEPGVDDTEGHYDERHFRNYNLAEELIVTWIKSFGKHNINATFNAMNQKYGFEGIGAGTDEMHYGDPQYWTIGGQQDYIVAYSDKWESALQGYMGRVSYNYNHKYYLDGTLRYDGSSKFAPENRWDFFPSFSAAWRISSEDFLKSAASWLTDLKLRGGWGKLGNQEISNYAFVSLANENPTVSFGYNPSARFPGMGYTYWGAAFNGMPNKDLTWEKTYTTDIGFDLILFNALSASVELYHKVTKDLLSAIEIPVSAGYVNNPPQNFGSVLNRGIDITLGYRGSAGQFNYKINGNISFVHNEVLSLKDDVPFGGNWGRVEEGKPLFFYRGYKTDGILQTDQEVQDYLNSVTDVNITPSQLAPGDYRFQDLRGNPDEEHRFYSPNPDGTINTYDQVYIGKTIPGYTYGLNIVLEYKGFDVSMLFNGVGDVQRYNSIRAGLEAMSSQGANQSTTVLDRWTPSHPSTTMPRAVFGDPSQNNRFSDRFIESAAYFRLNNLQFGYSLPDRVWKSLGFGKNLRIWAGISNLFTLTSWTGLDPSVPDGAIPTPRISSFGIDARF